MASVLNCHKTNRETKNHYNATNHHEKTASNHRYKTASNAPVTLFDTCTAMGLVEPHLLWLVTSVIPSSIPSSKITTKKHKHICKLLHIICGTMLKQLFIHCIILRKQRVEGVHSRMNYNKCKNAKNLREILCISFYNIETVFRLNFVKVLTADIQTDFLPFVNNKSITHNNNQ